MLSPPAPEREAERRTCGGDGASAAVIRDGAPLTRSHVPDRGSAPSNVVEKTASGGICPAASPPSAAPISPCAWPASPSRLVVTVHAPTAHARTTATAAARI